MIYNKEFIKPITKQIIVKKLNEIVVENDIDIRKGLIVELYSLDYIHNDYEYTIISNPLVIFQNQIFLCYNEREPTEKEYEDFFMNRIEDFKYKLENVIENKHKLTNTKLRNALFNMYYETDILKRMELLTNFTTPKKKTKNTPKISKQEVIKLLKKNDIYRIGNYHKMENATRATLLNYIPNSYLEKTALLFV